MKPASPNAESTGEVRSGDWFCNFMNDTMIHGALWGMVMMVWGMLLVRLNNAERRIDRLESKITGKEKTP